MKRFAAPIAIALALTALTAWLLLRGRAGAPASGDDIAATAATAAPTTAVSAASPPASAFTRLPGPDDGGTGPVPQGDRAQEIASLESMTKTLAEQVLVHRDVNGLIARLRSSGQQPLVARDRNEFTGEMTIVRTKSPPAGTRYFHAQYFSDDKGGSLPQHVSFEFKPGPRAFDDAVAAVKKAFPALGEPEVSKDDFIQWPLKDGYVVWIKKLGAEDVADDTMNPRSPEDVGTIWVAVELNPHDGETGHDH